MVVVAVVVLVVVVVDELVGVVVVVRPGHAVRVLVVPVVLGEVVHVAEPLDAVQEVVVQVPVVVVPLVPVVPVPVVAVPVLVVAVLVLAVPLPHVAPVVNVTVAVLNTARAHQGQYKARGGHDTR